MTNAVAARQPEFTAEQDEAPSELSQSLPPPMEWRSEARRALASDCLTLDGSGRIIRAGGQPTGFALNPLLSGRQVYLLDECGTRYWLGSPNRVCMVVRWLLS